MIVVLAIIIILVILLCKKVKITRPIIAVLIGFVVSIFCFSAFFTVLLIFSARLSILLPLLAVFYVSIIAFLIFWNKIETKKVYLILGVPGICILTAIAVMWYDSHIHQIPTISEEGSLWKYSPFREDSMLAKLDGESHLKLTDNLPALDGATALYPVYAAFAQAVYPEDEYANSKNLVVWNTTPKAYDNLLQGKADIIFCAAPSASQRKQFYDNGINLMLVPIGREAFVFFVNKKNIVDNVTIENIQGIYSGRIINWKELKGSNQKIRAFQRPENSGSQTALEKIMGNILIMEPRREDVSTGMGGIINRVAAYKNFPNAIGYSFLFYSTEMVNNDQIKLLSIEGVYPSRETIQNGRYPFSDNFYAIYIDTDDKNENIESFIEWILSEQGQELVSKTGYIPIKR
jgi:phosphate transport system substrate-binding protein